MTLTLDQENLPLLGIAAWSGTGKTTLLERLLPVLRERGMHVAVIKHAHHQFDVDQPGKDSHRLRQAGAAPMLVASRTRFALMMETPDQDEPDLLSLINQVRSLRPDLVLIEGFKSWPVPKLELHRVSLGKDMLAMSDTWVRAVACDAVVPVPAGVELLDLDDLDAIASWVMAWPSRWSSVRTPRAGNNEPDEPRGAGS
ncbi:molybdopterin-guanine dinucleotide biosynthesis protein B [Aidingimonas lacisalsi]|uniref:molybdopterin-guanine dinucleotide biosynthesis protein B n=1 Tax=Aidingimonas lacisalsi TaxID=2604086 RepID=UPI0011D290E8|nr:molybdopterin-guanine dinucleotide biosynthesis protein B [Aidingimonas lacisalsi]